MTSAWREGQDKDWPVWIEKLRSYLCTEIYINIFIETVAFSEQNKKFQYADLQVGSKLTSSCE